MRIDDTTELEINKNKMKIQAPGERSSPRTCLDSSAWQWCRYSMSLAPLARSLYALQGARATLQATLIPWEKACCWFEISPEGRPFAHERDQKCKPPVLSPYSQRAREDQTSQGFFSSLCHPPRPLFLLNDLDQWFWNSDSGPVSHILGYG